MTRKIARTISFGLTLISCLAAPTPAQECGKRTLQLDAVELLNGREVQGDAKYAVTRSGYVYHFASADSKAAFERAPEKYEIQLGGSCARMGPLSGEGSCDLFAVHDGKLYIFASDACRKGFLKAPEKQLETDDPKPAGDEAARKRGMELFELAVKAHGGPAIDAAKSYRQRVDAMVDYRGKPTPNNTALTIAFPDRARDDFTWDNSTSSHAMSGGQGAWIRNAAFDKVMAPSQVRAFQRAINRNLLTILKARTSLDFVAIRTGDANLDGTPVERVAVHFGGATSTLSIDPNSGNILAVAFPMQGGERGWYGVTERTFTEWTTASGILLPIAWTSTFDGKPAGNKPTRLTAVEVNPTLDAATFAVAER